MSGGEWENVVLRHWAAFEEEFASLKGTRYWTLANVAFSRGVWAGEEQERQRRDAAGGRLASAPRNRIAAGP